MTLTALRLANFKAFGNSQRIPLRPLTLLFGANSAGKSSVIHSLALAHHAAETGELDTQRTQIGGEAIDLGGFRQYVHRRQRDRRVELAFELDPSRLSGRVAQLLRSAHTVVVEISIGAGFTGNQRTLFGDFAREVDREGAVRVERFGLDVDGTPLLSMSARPGGQLRLDRLDHGHPVFREVFRGLVTFATTTQDLRPEDFEGLPEVLDALVPGIVARTEGLFPRLVEGSETREGESSEAFLAVSRGRRREDLAQAAKLFLPDALRDLVGGLASAVEGEVRRLRYLGPLRSYPPRHLAFDRPRRIEVHTLLDEDRTGTREYFQDGCRSSLPHCVPESLCLVLLRLRERSGGQRLHNRYILTDIGGVVFGAGLDDGPNGETDDVNLMDRAQYELRWSQHATDALAFEVPEVRVEVRSRD